MNPKRSKRKSAGAPSPARLVALDALLRVAQGGAFAAPVLDAAFRRQPLEPRDRGLATELTLGVLRWQGALDSRLAEATHRPLDSLDPAVLACLRLGAYQLLGPLRVPPYAAVAQTVDLVRSRRGAGPAKLANAVLRRLAPQGSTPPKEPALAARDALPPWLFQRLAETYGETDADATALESTQAPAASLRVETRKTSRPALLGRLRQESPQADIATGRLSPLAVRARGLGPLTALPSYRQGYCSVQDEGAQLCTLLLDLAPGHQVLDACAGRGGKTTLLASLGLGGITLDAADRHPGKLGQLQKEAKRLNLPTIRTVPVDLLVGTGDLAPSYDRILLDAPCSGTGTLARRPEIRWRLQPDDITRLAQTQWRLLQRCLDLLRPGGVLLYCSCSLLPDEGTGHLDRLLAESPPGQYAVTRRLQLVPHRHGTDGFFAARVARLR